VDFGVWPETAIRLTLPPAILPARLEAAWLLWLEARHRTSLAVQQQGFDYRQQC